MKKMLLTIAMCFFVLGLVAQEEKSIYLSDQNVLLVIMSNITNEEKHKGYVSFNLSLYQNSKTVTNCL